jgi:hypothetical protein
MPRTGLLRCCIVPGALVALLPAAAATAGSPFAGFYFGSTSGSCEAGTFAVGVRDAGTAVVLSFDPIDEEGFTNTNVTIDADGTFSAPNIDGQGTNASGAFSAEGVSGNFQSTDCSGTFSGAKAACGALESGAGFFSGALAGNVTIIGEGVFPHSGTIDVLIAGNGQTFAFADTFSPPLSAGVQDGGPITTSPSGSLSGTLGLGIEVMGTVDLEEGSGMGTLFFEGPGGMIDGSWAIDRLEPIPCPAPCALLLQGAALAAAGRLGRRGRS